MAERPEDLNLPNSVIARIIKEALPEGVNVSKDAKLAIAKAASVFVLYATTCANTFTIQHKRKTITGQDVLEAMSEMEFEQFIEPLQNSLSAYRKGQQGKKEAAAEKRKKAAEGNKEQGKNGAAAAADGEEMEDEDGGEEENAVVVADDVEGKEAESEDVEVEQEGEDDS